MQERVSSPVSVTLIFNHRTRSVYPQSLTWDGRDYTIVKVGLHHTFRQGKTLFHVFSAASSTVFFRLVLNTDNLSWRLEEISDGLPD